MILIAVDSSRGCIGPGKSSLSKALAQSLRGAVVYPEKVCYEYLDSMYDDIKNGVRPSRAATVMQFRVMADRHATCWRAIHHTWRTGEPSVIDRYLPSDRGFAHRLWKDGFISDLDYETYERHFANMEKYILPPQILIDIQASEETCISRIRAMGPCAGCP